MQFDILFSVDMEGFDASQPTQSPEAISSSTLPASAQKDPFRVIINSREGVRADKKDQRFTGGVKFASKPPEISLPNQNPQSPSEANTPDTLGNSNSIPYVHNKQ